MKPTAQTPMEIIRDRASRLNCKDALDELLIKYPQFEWWSGSHQEGLHHYGDGGLAKHTSEVIELGLSAILTLNLIQKADQVEFFLAALFHDTGKMFDYKLVEGVPIGVAGRWAATEHRRLIHHLPRSLMIWHDVAQNPKYESYHDPVAHAILAHHGQREWGSPVAPKTRVAWMLHLSDSISARMNDADTLDVVHKHRG